MVISLRTATDLADIQLPNYDATVPTKLSAIEKVREETLHQVIGSETGEEYYIAEILPGGVYGLDLSLANVGQRGNPLDVVLGQVRTGMSQNFVTEVTDSKTWTNSEDMGIVLAQFDDMEKAYNYYRDEVNYCVEMDRIFGTCGEGYKYQVLSAVSDPLTTYENLQSVWLVFRVGAAVLIVIAMIIAVSTYSRLISKDTKIIALYHAMGVTGWQIRLVYTTYLLIISLMAVIFAVVVGLMLAAGLSLVNMPALKQVFTLGFGVARENIWLVGWNNLVWLVAGLMILIVMVAVVLGNGNFRVKELARKLK